MTRARGRGEEWPPTEARGQARDEAPGEEGREEGREAREAQAKPPRIHEVAAALGLHKSTVSLAFSGKGNLAPATRQRILSAAREMGYEPNPLAQRLAHGGRSNVVAIFSGVLDVGLGTEKILLIQRALSHREADGRTLDVPIHIANAGSAGGSSQAAQARGLCRQKPRAIVCAAQALGPAVLDEFEAYRRAGGIVVTYDAPTPLECDQVVFDREHNAYLAARHLIEQGHRRIGLSISPASAAPSDEAEAGALGPAQAMRVAGFRRALEEAGLEARPEWLFQNPTYERGGAALAHRFLALPLGERPTGLCIVNDYVALGFMAEVLRAGLRVPDDVSVVGHDDQPVARYCPVPLACSSQPVEQIVRGVVDLLGERLAGSTAPSSTLTIRGSLVPRQSVGPPPA